MQFIIDTHILKWYLQDSSKLSYQARSLIDDEQESQIIIPSIVLAELLYISRKVVLPVPIKETFNLLQNDSRFSIYPLDQKVIEQAIPLIQYEMHDALIMATALHLSLPVMTQDHQIASSQLVRVLPC